MMGFIRGVVSSMSSAAGKLARFSATGRTDESIEDREVMQHYGFSSRAKAGAECLILKQGNHILMVSSDDRRYRIALEAGEVAIYTDEGDKILFKRGKEIQVRAGTKVSVDAPGIELGTTLLESVLKGETFMNFFNSHTHTGGFVTPTSPPSVPATAPLHLSQKVKAQ